MRTLMVSSSVSGASFSEAVVKEPLRGTAPTLVGCRGPKRAPAQKAPSISTSAARMIRARFDVLPASMELFPSFQLDVLKYRQIRRSQSPRGFAAVKPGAQRLYLPASLFQCAGTIDSFRGITHFFFDAHLRGNAAPRFFFAETSPGQT